MCRQQRFIASIALRVALLSLLCLAGCTTARTAIPPTPTSLSTATRVPPTATPTRVPPTQTPAPTSTPTPIPPTATLTPLPGPKAGRWEGDSISFEVTTDRKIHNLTIVIPFGGDKCQLKANEDAEIEKNGTFLVGERDTDGSLMINSVSGEFTSPTTLIGKKPKGFSCGGWVTFSSSDSWSAIWQAP